MVLLSGYRLSHIRIGVTDNNPKEHPPNVTNLTVCARKNTSMEDGSESFPCTARGRYLVIINEAKDFLTLCEVEVYGHQQSLRKYTNYIVS